MSLTTQELIVKLDSWLHQNRPDYYECLQPGLSDEEMAAFETKLGLKLPEDFKLFYSWKNGQVTDRIQSFAFNSEIMNSGQIIETFEGLNSMLDIGAFAGFEHWWDKKWVPFLYDGCGNNHCIDLVGSFGGKPNQIITYWHDSDVREILHESFYKWLETVVKACAIGLYTDDEWYGFDYDKYEAFAKENNPGHPWDYRNYQ